MGKYAELLLAEVNFEDQCRVIKDRNAGPAGLIEYRVEFGLSSRKGQEK